MIIDLQKPSELSHEPASLFAMLTALIGQRCLKADVSAGPELLLHIGEPVAYLHPGLADEKHGAWILTTRASGWRLLLNDPPVLIESGWFPEKLSEAIFGDSLKEQWKGAKGEPIQGEDVERRAEQLAGKAILTIEPYGFPVAGLGQSGIGLVIRFSGGSSLAMVPSQEPDPDDEPLADWELYTPYHTYLRVGPGPKWSYLYSKSVTKPA